MGWAFHVKRSELLMRYRNYKKEKCKQSVFIARVTRYWYSKTKAIRLWDCRDWKHLLKSEIKEDWRVCVRCWQFKPWDLFSKDKQFRMWYTSDCKECRNKIHQEHRNKDHHSKDHEYKIRKRKLQIGDKIAFLKPIIIDDILREDVWKVICYQMKKWYTIESIYTKKIRQLDTWDNATSPKFYKIIE